MRLTSGAGAAAGTAGERVSVPGYEIDGELGRGGMGVVYKARQVSLRRTVALKMILAGGHAGTAELARFRTEAEAIARLQHPHIVQVHEVGEHEGRPFFSLEFVEGGSLAAKLDGTPWLPRDAARLVETLARAMHHAHQHHVIHRDLKPANVLLTPDGQPKVTDFGLAKKLDEAGLTHSGAVMGTPGYMAPEQAEGKRDVGPAADIYALGAILYELLTGAGPFSGATPLDAILRVLSEEPVPPRRLRAQVPRGLETVCLKCLEKDPRQRYASAQDLADDLGRWLQGVAPLARPPALTGRLARWARQRPALAATLCALLVLYANHLLLIAAGVEGQGGSYHWFVTGLVLVWAASAVGCQRLASRPGWRWRATYAWAALDVLLFTALLLRGNGPQSTLLVAYQLLIAGAALRSRIALVWCLTGLCSASYLALQADALWRRPEEKVAVPAHAAVIFVLSLVLMGLIMSLLLRRFRLALAQER
jgi:serine/threonine-protein kinase